MCLQRVYAPSFVISYITLYIYRDFSSLLKRYIAATLKDIDLNITLRLLRMGFQWIIVRRSSTHYERLDGDFKEEKVARSPRRRSWVRKMNGRLKGLRLLRSRKLNWKTFSVMIFPRRVAGIYADIVNTLKMDGAYPAIVFCGQLGLPVLSHSNFDIRKSAISFDRKPGFMNELVFAK